MVRSSSRLVLVLVLVMGGASIRVCALISGLGSCANASRLVEPFALVMGAQVEVFGSSVCSGWFAWIREATYSMPAASEATILTEGPGVGVRLCSHGDSVLALFQD